MRDIKGDSSLWINNNKLVVGKFWWQEGYGAFSYSKSQIAAVATYIENQKLHHKKITFIEEYKKILQDLEIEFDEKYIFRTIGPKRSRFETTSTSKLTHCIKRKKPSRN